MEAFAEEFYSKKGYYMANADLKFNHVHKLITSKDLEKHFWNLIEQDGGFKTCPTCGSVPRIIKFGEPPRPHNYSCGYVSPSPNIVILEGIDQKYTANGTDYYLEIKYVYCCEFLFNLENKKWYVQKHNIPSFEHLKCGNLFINSYSFADYKRLEPSQDIKDLMWKLWIGDRKKSSVCTCCEKFLISKEKFFSILIESIRNGGEIKYTNLLPVCSRCKYIIYDHEGSESFKTRLQIGSYQIPKPSGAIHREPHERREMVSMEDPRLQMMIKIISKMNKF